jgi:hypothetical protein
MFFMFVFGGTKELRLFRKPAYLWYFYVQPYRVAFWNVRYVVGEFMATTLTAIIMFFTFPVFVFYKIFRGRSFDFDFDKIDERGKVYNWKMGLVWHYWKDDRYQTLFAAGITWFIDGCVAALGLVPLIGLQFVYWPMFLYEFVMKWSTADFWLRTFTPWSEKNYETPSLWWSQAEKRDVMDF